MILRLSALFILFGLLALSVLFGLYAFPPVNAQTQSCEDRCIEVTQQCLEPCRQEALRALVRCEEAGGSSAACEASYNNTYSACLSRESATIDACKNVRGCRTCYACPDWRLGGLGIPYFCECGNPYGSCFEVTPDLTGGESPVLIDVLGNGLELTSPSDGVFIDLNGDGVKELRSWTVSGSDDSWLALDRSKNGLIDSGLELFGDITPQPDSSSRNGFLALAEFDKAINGGNADGVIDYRDQVFGSLRLWQDLNHNGLSERNELILPRDRGIKEFDLAYKESKNTDEHGNEFRYRAKVRSDSDSRVARWAWDVFLVRQ